MNDKEHGSIPTSLEMDLVWLNTWQSWNPSTHGMSEGVEREEHESVPISLGTNMDVAKELDPIPPQMERIYV